MIAMGRCNTNEGRSDTVWWCATQTALGARFLTADAPIPLIGQGEPCWPAPGQSWLSFPHANLDRGGRVVVNGATSPVGRPTDLSESVGALRPRSAHQRGVGAPEVPTSDSILVSTAPQHQLRGSTWPSEVGHLAVWD